MPGGRQPAFSQDQDQGGVAQDLGQLCGVELNAETGFADGDADAEIQQQRGQTGPQRQAHRSHGYQQHEGPDQQGEVEIGDGKRCSGSDVS